MSKRIRIKDIAKKAGVSTGTVDRVIHNRGNVSPKARQKVQEVMQELDYEPNIIASTLAYNRTVEIAALMPDPSTDKYWSYPLRGIQKAAQAYQHFGVQVKPYFFNLFDAETFLQIGQDILDSKPDALLFPPVFQKESIHLLKILEERDIAVSCINTDVEGGRVLSYVGQDSYQSGVLAGKLLNIAHTHPQKSLVLHLGNDTTNAKHLIDKERGIKDYYTNKFAGEAPVIGAHFDDFDDEKALRSFFMDLLSKNPDLSGVFITNSRAYKLIKALKGLDISHLRIIGFDLLPENLAYLEEQKISFLINQNSAQQGYLGVMNIVNKLIYKKEVDRIQYLPLDIVVTENASYYLDREFQFVL